MPVPEETLEAFLGCVSKLPRILSKESVKALHKVVNKPAICCPTA
ncbi:hypothetical protein [Scytonema sp. NUACC26]